MESSETSLRPPQPPASIRLEICVDTANGLTAAVDNGADRVELCAALSEGGLTPSKGMMELAALVSRSVRAMIRPRAGNFIYSSAEIDIMRRDIEQAAACDLEGVVLGCNTDSGALDETTLATLVGHARAFGLKVTLHRSFDLTPDPLHALSIATTLKIDTILTSGLQTTALMGLDVIAALTQAARTNNGVSAIEIMAGSGVTPFNVETLIKQTGIRAVHASCSRPRSNPHASGDRLGLYTAAQRETDPTLIAQLRATLDQLTPKIR